MIRKSRLVMMALAALAPALAAADNGCQQVVALGSTQATGPTTFMGDADSNLGMMYVDVELTSSKPNADGSIIATTTHTFTVGSLVFTTRDRARLIPLNAFGLYRLDTQATVAEGGSGHLKLDGLLNFATGTARWLAEGVVCPD